MSSPDDRLNAIQTVYLDATNNEPNDLAAARTAAQVTAVQANLAVARSTYFAAEAVALTSDADGVESAYQAAQSASEAVKAARAAAAKLPKLLGALNKATESASSLLTIAKA